MNSYWYTPLLQINHKSSSPFKGNNNPVWMSFEKMCSCCFSTWLPTYQITNIFTYIRSKQWGIGKGRGDIFMSSPARFFTKHSFLHLWNCIFCKQPSSVSPGWDCFPIRRVIQVLHPIPHNFVVLVRYFNCAVLNHTKALKNCYCTIEKVIFNLQAFL